MKRTANGGSATQGKTRQQRALDRLREVAEARGGRFLERSAGALTDKYLWECAQGHRWRARGANVVYQGSWCPQCTYAKRVDGTLDRIRKAAKARGGRCLERSAGLLTDKYLWECAQGHRWRASAASILNQGSWCPQCANRDGHAKLANGMEWLHDLAAHYHGECLASEYKNALTKYAWRCEHGHEFSKTANHVSSGSWCPLCGGGKKSLDYLGELAREHGGRCLAKRFTGEPTRYPWECANGHRWRAQYATVRNGEWCPRCREHEQDEERTAEGRARLRALAAAHGGECLSKTYQRIDNVYQWRCAQGHTFMRTGITVDRGYWCPVCATVAIPRSVADLQAVAASYGGQSLARRYQGAKKQYPWRCAKGHEWRALAREVRAGAWCPQCEPRGQTGPWTKAEDRTLARYYPTEGITVARRIKQRPLAAIKARVRALGLHCAKKRAR